MFTVLRSPAFDNFVLAVVASDRECYVDDPVAVLNRSEDSLHEVLFVGFSQVVGLDFTDEFPLDDVGAFVEVVVDHFVKARVPKDK